MRISKTSRPAWGLDSRIGPKFLRAGLGYGGSCFPKDVAAFYWVAQQQGVDFQILEEVRKINATQQELFFNKVRSALWTLRGKKLAALGLAFKGDTDDIRDSPAIDVIKKLIAAGATISAYDPAATEKAKGVLPASESISYAASAYEAAEGADAVLILTDWAEFAQLDLVRLDQALKFPIVIDGRNLYKPAHMHEQGFTYVSVGRPAAYTAQQGNRSDWFCRSKNSRQFRRAAGSPSSRLFRAELTHTIPNRILSRHSGA